MEYINTLVENIHQADDIQLSEIIKAVIRRYGILHPDWEIMFLSLPRDDAVERSRCVEETITFLRSMSHISLRDCHTSLRTGSQ